MLIYSINLKYFHLLFHYFKKKHYDFVRNSFDSKYYYFNMNYPTYCHFSFIFNYKYWILQLYYHHIYKYLIYYNLTLIDICYI